MEDCYSDPVDVLSRTDGSDGCSSSYVKQMAKRFGKLTFI